MAENNVRIIYDNAADRGTLTASSTAGVLTVANLRDDKKSSVWRSTGTTATLTLEWATPETISGVVLPFCNFTASATIRLKGYVGTGPFNLVMDTGNVVAAPNGTFGIFNWGSSAIGVNTYAYGGGTYGRIWVPIYDIKSLTKLEIIIIDTANTQGYIECSRLVAGVHWAPKYNVGYEIPVTLNDASSSFRNDASDLITEIGPQYKSLSLGLSNMINLDRTKLLSILRGNGKSKPLFISVFPNDFDTDKEQTYQIYGKLANAGSINYINLIQYTSQIDIEEI